MISMSPGRGITYYGTFGSQSWSTWTTHYLTAALKARKSARRRDYRIPHYIHRLLLLVTFDRCQDISKRRERSREARFAADPRLTGLASSFGKAKIWKCPSRQHLNLEPGTTCTLAA